MIDWLADKAGKLSASLGRYIAAEPNDRRRDPGTRIKSSDQILSDTKRRKVIEGARELWRNYSVAAWAIRKHLDFVSTFTFQAQTGDPDLNAELENLMDWYSRPLNCDVAGRHSLRRMMRILEARRVIDGDVFIVKMSDGKLQAIEGDRVRDPSVRPDDVSRYIHGVRVNQAGKMLGVSVHRRRTDGHYVHERDITAGNVIQLGYFDSFDQVRGVSPLVSAIAAFQDALEVKDYALAKAKITQLFALAITREMADMDDDDEGDTLYSYDLGKGPIMMDLDPGDRAEFLESKHPSTEFQSFLTMTLQAALKSLDIPWSMYDEAYTNFFGSKAALQGYLTSCKAKREDLKETLNRITGWRVSKWVARGVLQLPAGVTLDQLKWDWIPAGVPWWDVQKEVAGDVAAIQAGLRTRSEIRRERFGDDWKQVVVKQAEEQAFLEELGLASSETADQQQSGSEPSIKDIVDAYGSGVRAGTITPQSGDEDHFRGLMGLPPVSPPVATQWQQEPTRRPITIVKPGDPQADPVGDQPAQDTGGADGSQPQDA